MQLDFRIIPHKRQRYDTCGDYFHKGRTVHFRVSRMKDFRYHLLIFIHEIIEYLLCRQAKVKLRDINKFDIDYERQRRHQEQLSDFDSLGSGRAPCGCAFEEEPGDDIHAPYHRQHQVATACEKLIAESIGVNWEAYARAVEDL